MNQKYNEAIYFQTAAIDNLNNENDIYMMMLGNYLLSTEDTEKVRKSIHYLKKSLHYS